MWRGWLLSLLLLGCGSAVIPPPPPPEPEPELPPDDELLASRPFRVVTPPDYDGGTPLPLVLALHGYGGSGANLDDRLNLSRYTQSRDMLLVLPNAVPDATGARAWHPVLTVAKYPFDKEYLRAIIKRVKTTHAVDPVQVFVFGYSQGGHMAHRMGCEAADELAAVAVLAGQAPVVDGECVPARPISVLQVHGTDDEAIAYDGDTTPPIDPRVPSAHQSVELWARLDGCGPLVTAPRTLDLSVTAEGDETTIEAAEACPAGIGVELWTMHGVQHWPAPQPNFIPLIFGFLATHPRP